MSENTSLLFLTDRLATQNLKKNTYAILVYGNFDLLWTC